MDIEKWRNYDVVRNRLLLAICQCDSDIELEKAKSAPDVATIGMPFAVDSLWIL